MSKLEKFVIQARELVKKDYTASNPEFIAWNNSLIRYMESNYGIDSTTTTNFKDRSYSLCAYALGTPDSYFIKAYQKDMETTLRELEILLEEEQDSKINNSYTLTDNSMSKVTNMYIISDMKEIENVLNNNVTDLNVLKRLHKKIDSKYQSCIKDWAKSMWGWNPDFGFNYEFLGESSLIDNLESMLYKLSAYSMNLNDISKEDNMIFQPIINNTNNNNNNNQLNIQINFNQIRKKFEIDDNYSTDEKNEIIDKINELEKIYISTELKTKKWEKVKSILGWLLDKGIDIGIAFLPVIYQMFQQ